MGLIRSVVSPWTGEFPSIVPGREDSNNWEVEETGGETSIDLWEVGITYWEASFSGCWVLHHKTRVVERLGVSLSACQPCKEHGLVLSIS